MSEEEVSQSVDEAYKEMMSDAEDGIIESLKEIEEKLFEQFGDPNDNGEVWAVISSADRDGTDPFVEDRIEVVLTGKGPDLYSGLQNQELAVAHSLMKGRIGTLVRSGAWMGPTNEHKPSDHPERKSCIITCSFLANHVFFVIRFEDGTVEASSINETEYNEGRAGGQQRLVDALLDFDYLPTALKEHEYDQYMDIVEALKKSMNEEQTE